MKAAVYESECPEQLAERAAGRYEEERHRYYYGHEPEIWAVWQEERDGLLCTWLCRAGKIVDEGDRTPDYLIAADMEKERWATYSFAGGKWGEKMMESIVYDPEDIVGEWIDRECYGRTLREMQTEASCRKCEKRREKKRQQRQADMEKAGEIPQAFLAWEERQLDPYLVYEPGDRHRGYCTRCGKESFFAEKMKCHGIRTCPSCRSRCTVKTQRTLPEELMVTAAYVQATDSGIMVRFITMYKKMEDAGRGGSIRTYEGLRIVADRGLKEKWYEKVELWGRNGWHKTWQRNTVEGWTRSENSPYRKKEGHAVRNGENIPAYRRNLLKIIEDSSLRYIRDREELMQQILQYREGIREGIFAFISLYSGIHRNPQAESLWKLGFRKLAVQDILLPGSFRPREKKLWRCLGISREMWRFLLQEEQEERENIDTARIREAAYYDRICSDKKLAWEASGKIPSYYRKKLQDLNLKRMLTYLDRNMVQLYGDYITMARQLGYDLKDDFVAFPKDLKEAHDTAVAVREEREEMRRLEEAKKDDHGIQRIYKKICRKYSAECGGFLFRPAASNTEIVKEGHALHHCVGMGIYKNKMLKGESCIVFMRKKEDPETPYYTLEISPEGTVLQAYGKFNKKPDWDEAGPAIREYSGKVRERACQKALCRTTGGTREDFRRIFGKSYL